MQTPFRVVYGEENDFCMRALRCGWRHVQDDRTWVYHVRSVSLGAEVAALGESGMAILDKRYADYRALVESGLQSERRARASDRIRRAIDAVPGLSQQPRPRVLAIGRAQTHESRQSAFQFFLATGEHLRIDPAMARSARCYATRHAHTDRCCRFCFPHES